jgi:hypothetical protein
MKIPKSLSNLITNKYVLYLVATIAFLNVFGYMVLGNINAVIFFILVGYITTFFSKNMMIVLFVPMVLTNFLMAGLKVKEGIVGSMDSNKDKDKGTQNSTNPVPKPDAQKDHQIVLPPHDPSHDEVAADHSNANKSTDEPFEGRQPLEYSDIKKKGKSTGTRLDHGATVENAYDTLNKIIGGPGFSKMTDDTKRLMEQQQKLAQSMEQFGPMLDSIKPFLEKAQGLLGNMDIKGISEMANQTKV